jgi:hypothetical protein
MLPPDQFSGSGHVAYAQWFTYAFALWEEQFRGRVAAYFDQRSDERVRRSDVLIDYFGDIRLIRNDFVRNKGICKECTDLKVLQWGPHPRGGQSRSQPSR